MERLIKYSTELIYPHMKKQSWGSLGLPRNYQLDFDFRCDVGCYLELMNDCYKSVKIMEFSTFKNGDWLTMEDFDKKISELFEGNKFRERDINKFFKWIRVQRM